MLRITKSFERICGEYDMVMLDTSVCRRIVKYNKRENEILERFGYRKRVPYENQQENITYICEMTETMARHPNVCTVKGVVEEINRGLSILGNTLGSKKHGRRRKIKTYISAVKGLRNILKDRIISFPDEELVNLDILENEMDYFKEVYGISNVDFEILFNSVNAATYRGDTALISNDVPLLDAALNISVYPEETLLPIGAMPLKYKFKPHTSLRRNYFAVYYHRVAVQPIRTID